MVRCEVSSVQRTASMLNLPSVGGVIEVMKRAKVCLVPIGREYPFKAVTEPAVTGRETVHRGRRNIFPLYEVEKSVLYDYKRQTANFIFTEFGFLGALNFKNA